VCGVRDGRDGARISEVARPPVNGTPAEAIDPVSGCGRRRIRL
jgi:hypothetical protein